MKGALPFGIWSVRKEIQPYQILEGVLEREWVQKETLFPSWELGREGRLGKKKRISNPSRKDGKIGYFISERFQILSMKSVAAR